MGLKTRSAQCHGMFEGDHTLGHKGIADRNIQFFSEQRKLLPGLGAYHTVAREYHG